MALVNLVIGMWGIPKAISVLGNTIFAFITVLSMLLDGVTTFAAAKLLTKVIGKEDFANMDFAASTQTRTVLGTVGFATTMVLYLAAWIGLPYVPKSIMSLFGQVAGLTSGSEDVASILLLLCLLMIVLLGTYHMVLQKNKRKAARRSRTGK